MPENSKDANALCEELWTKYEPRLRRICQSKLDSCPQEVDEIISEAYLILLEALNKNKEILNPVAWLYGTVNNLIKMKYTQIKRGKETQRSLFDYDNNLMYDVPYNVDYLEAIVSDGKIENMYYDIIDKELTPEELELYNRTVDKKISYQELAKVYNSTDTAVKQRAYRLRKKLRELAKDKTKNPI